MDPTVPMAMASTLLLDHSQNPAVPSRQLPQAGPGYSVVWSPVFSTESGQLCKGEDIHRALYLQYIHGKKDCEISVLTDPSGGYPRIVMLMTRRGRKTEV